MRCGSYRAWRCLIDAIAPSKLQFSQSFGCNLFPGTVLQSTYKLLLKPLEKKDDPCVQLAVAQTYLHLLAHGTDTIDLDGLGKSSADEAEGDITVGTEKAFGVILDGLREHLLHKPVTVSALGLHFLAQLLPRPKDARAKQRLQMPADATQLTRPPRLFATVDVLRTSTNLVGSILELLKEMLAAHVQNLARYDDEAWLAEFHGVWDRLLRASLDTKPLCEDTSQQYVAEQSSFLPFLEFATRVRDDTLDAGEQKRRSFLAKTADRLLGALLSGLLATDFQLNLSTAAQTAMGEVGAPSIANELMQLWASLCIDDIDGIDQRTRGARATEYMPQIVRCVPWVPLQDSLSPILQILDKMKTACESENSELGSEHMLKMWCIASDGLWHRLEEHQGAADDDCERFVRMLLLPFSSYSSKHILGADRTTTVSNDFWTASTGSWIRLYAVFNSHAETTSSSGSSAVFLCRLCDGIQSHLQKVDGQGYHLKFFVTGCVKAMVADGPIYTCADEMETDDDIDVQSFLRLLAWLLDVSRNAFRATLDASCEIDLSWSVDVLQTIGKLCRTVTSQNVAIALVTSIAEPVSCWLLMLSEGEDFAQLEGIAEKMFNLENDGMWDCFVSCLDRCLGEKSGEEFPADLKEPIMRAVEAFDKVRCRSVVAEKFDLPDRVVNALYPSSNAVSSNLPTEALHSLPTDHAIAAAMQGNSQNRLRVQSDRIHESQLVSPACVADSHLDNPIAIEMACKAVHVAVERSSAKKQESMEDGAFSTTAANQTSTSKSPSSTAKRKHLPDDTGTIGSTVTFCRCTLCIAPCVRTAW